MKKAEENQDACLGRIDSNADMTAGGTSLENQSCNHRSHMIAGLVPADLDSHVIIVHMRSKNNTANNDDNIRVNAMMPYARGAEGNDGRFPGTESGGRMSQYLEKIRKMDSTEISMRLSELKRKASSGDFTSKEDELFLGKVIFDSHPWDYPTEVNGSEFKSESDYPKRTRRQLRNAELAKSILAIAYRRLVLKYASNYYELMKHYIPQDEIEMNGYKGMAIALNKYDYRRENKFSSYLTWYVFRDVHRDSHLMSKSRIVNVPASDVKKYAQIDKRLDNGEKLDDVIADFGMTRSEYNMLANADKTYASLDQRIGDGDGGDATLMDMCRNATLDPSDDTAATVEDMMEDEALMRDLSLSIAALPERQRELISRLYGPDRMSNGRYRPVSDTRCREEMGMGKREYTTEKENALKSLHAMMTKHGWNPENQVQ